MNMMNLLPWVVIACMIMAFALLIVLAAVVRSKRDEQIEDTPAEQTSFPTTEVTATVVDYACCVKMVGTRTPKTVKEFVVAFETDAGDIMRFAVSEEMYDGFEKGQKGLLTVVDGTLYSFVPDEAELEEV